jgi:hypothetical protein
VTKEFDCKVGVLAKPRSAEKPIVSVGKPSSRQRESCIPVFGGTLSAAAVVLHMSPHEQAIAEARLILYSQSIITREQQRFVKAGYNTSPFLLFELQLYNVK